MRTWFSARRSSAARPANARKSRGLHLESLESREVFAAGELDTSFGTSGLVRLTNDPSNVDVVRAGSNLYLSNGSSSVAKLTTNGALETGYGNGGLAPTQHYFFGVQSTGAVVTAKTEFTSFTTRLDAYFRGLTTTGGSNATFGVASGQTTLDFLTRLTNPGSSPIVYDNVGELIVDSSDKVWGLVHGDLENSDNFYSDHFAGVVRMTSNGQLDASFGTGGLAVIQAPFTDAFLATDMKLTADGGAIIAGVYRSNGVATAALYKINSTGAVVTSFGTAGKALLTQLGNIAQYTNIHVALDPTTGGYYVGAYEDPLDGTYNLRLAKATSAGAAVMSFGTNGVANTGNIETNFTLSNDGFALAVQNDGKPIVVYGGPAWKMSRFTTGGVADTNFGVNGVVETSLGTDVGAYATPQGVTVQSDGMILVYGKYSPGGAAQSQSVVARYHSIDLNGAPTTNVSALSATSYQNNLTVSWSGTPSPGTSITGYDVYYQIAGQNAVLWQSNTAATSAIFNVNAARGKSVSFYSAGRDNLNRVEAAPSTPDATTNYVGAPWQNPVDRFDVLTGGTDTGSIDPGDILFVITEYTNAEISNPITKEVILPPTKTYTNGRFVDVDGDNLISPSDILFVIIRYNEVLAGGEGEGSVAAAAVAPPVTTPPSVAAVSSAPAKDSAAYVAGSTDDDLLAQLAAAWLSGDDKDE